MSNWSLQVDADRIAWLTCDMAGSSANVLSRITDFFKEQDPDVVGLIEVDTGSIRTGMVNQADFIARSLGHYST